MPVVVCSSGNLKDYLPAGLTYVKISSLTDLSNVTGKYIQAKIYTKYILHTGKRTSIKLVLKRCSGKLIDLHAFGPIAADLDTCSVGYPHTVQHRYNDQKKSLCFTHHFNKKKDSLVLSDFEIDACSRDKRTHGPFQIILDDIKPVKMVVWVLKASQNGSNANCLDPGGNATPGTSSTVSSCHKQKNSIATTYVYTLLKDATIATKANIYGVVSYIKPVIRTNGSDYYMMVNIVDASLPNIEEKLTCNLFHDDRKMLPTQATVGDIIRFHRLKIQTYQGKHQGRSGPGFQWVLFQGSYERRISSSENYTLQNIDKDKVEELLKWWEDVVPLYSQGSDLLVASELDTSRATAPLSPAPSSSGLSNASPPTPSMDKLTPMKVPPVVFKTLKQVNEVRENATVNLYAVVIYCRSLIRTVRSDYHLMLNISDPSIRNNDAKLTCNLFDADKGRLPHQACRGDVIRFHDLQITIYKGKRQGVKGPNFGWVLFQSSFDTRLASYPGLYVKNEEKNKVQSLLDWWQEGPPNISFSNVAARQYFNLVCQVIVGVHVEDSFYRLFKVWDGTRFDGPILKQSLSGDVGNALLAKVAGDLNLVHDLYLFDNHIPSSQNIKPGDFIQLTNLHAAIVNNQVEMTLHGGTAYQRGVKKLSAEDRAVIQLKAVLNPLISKCTDRGPSKKDDGSSGAPKADSNSVSPSSKKNFCTRKSPRSGTGLIGGASTSGTSSCHKSIFNDEPSIETKSKNPSVSRLSKQDSSSRKSPGTSAGINYGASSSAISMTRATASRKRLFNDESSEFEPQRKTLVISLTPIDFGHDARNAVVATTDTNNSVTAAPSRPPALDDINTNASVEYDRLTLSFSSPPPSLELSERDRYMVEAFLAKERNQAEYQSHTVNINQHVTENESQQTKDSQLSGISVLSSQSIELSMYGASSGGDTEENSMMTDKVCSNSLRENLTKDKNISDSCTINTQKGGKEKEEAVKTSERVQSNAEISNDRDSVCNQIFSKEKTTRVHMNELDSLDSSQESFHTAKDIASPFSRGILETLSSNIRSHLRESSTIGEKDNSKTNSNELNTRRSQKQRQQAMKIGNRRSSRLKGSNVRDDSGSGSDESRKDDKLGVRNTSRKTTKNSSSRKPKPNKDRRLDDIIEQEKELDEISLSQDSYHTAINPASPIMSGMPHLKPHQSPVTSPHMYLSLRSSNSYNDPPTDEHNTYRLVDKDKEIEPIMSGMPHLKPHQSPVISPRRCLSLRSSKIDNDPPTDEHNTSSSTCRLVDKDKEKERSIHFSNENDKEGGDDNTVSSSADSIPNDRQPSQVNTEISSSTTSSKDSAISHERTQRRTTVTASISNHFRKHFKLRTFISCKRATKFKVLVRLCRYYPCTGNVSDLVQLCCFACKYVVSSSETRSKRTARCPNGCGNLETHIIMNMHLTDGVHEINTMLLGQNAIQFFQGVTPADLLHKTSAKEKVQKCLDTICPPGTDLENRPFMECCVFSSIIRCKMQFQIFDTVVL